MRMLTLLMLVGLWGCSLEKWALRQATPAFKRASDALTTESHWEFFRQSTPGNLKFLELMYLQDKGNLGLLSVVIKGYSGYAFAVAETLMLEDTLQDLSSSKWKKEAIFFYTRALDYGLYYLSQKNVASTDLLSLSGEELKQKLKQELDDDDLSAVLYTAQAWGSLVNLQKDNVALVAQVPKVKVLFDWVCERNPKIDYGVCPLFYAQYEASRPRMLGGNPARGEALFKEAMSQYPQHLLVKVQYIQQVLLPAYDQGNYEKLAQQLKHEFREWENLKRDSLQSESSYRQAAELNLYNAIAKKRFQFIEKYKSHIF